MNCTRKTIVLLVFFTALLASAQAYACGFGSLIGYGAIKMFYLAAIGIAAAMLMVSLYHVLLRRYKRKGKWLSDTLFPLAFLMTICTVSIITVQIDDIFFHAAHWVWSIGNPPPENLVMGCDPPSMAPAEMFSSIVTALFWLWIFRLATQTYKLFPPFFRGQSRKKILAIVIVLFIWAALHFYARAIYYRWQ